MNALLAHGSATQAQLVAATGLSRPTLRNALDRLVEDRLVSAVDDPTVSSVSAGRRPVAYHLTRAAGVAVGEQRATSTIELGSVVE